MTIGGYNFFMGAYAERMADRTLPSDSWRQISGDAEKEAASQVTEALQMVKSSRSNQDFITISEEGKAFLCGDAVKDNMKETSALLERMYTDNGKLLEKLGRTDPEDPFWGNAGDQWLVFSEHLHSYGFYDAMSDEEVMAVETLLDQMTGGMDGVSRVLYDTGTGLNLYDINNLAGTKSTGFDLFNETSEALAMDLESSTAALKYFGEKYIADETLRDEFNGLADRYYAHNTAILKGYQSPAEKMRKFTSDVYGGKYPGSAIFNKFGQAAAKQHPERLHANRYLGSVSHSGEEENQYKKDISTLLGQLRQGTSGWEDMWKKLGDMLADYAAGGSGDEGIRRAVSEQAGSTFDRMKGYWSLLLERENGL